MDSTTKKGLNLNVRDIKNPTFLRDLSYEQLDELSIKIRQEIIKATSVNGGHLSSNLGVTDLIVSLHRNFDFKTDKLLFDVGHQCYAHKILTGRNISKLRTKGGVSGFIKSHESPYDIFEAGHSSTSLSAAMAYAIDRDNKNEKHEVVALIGDASIANGVAFEALNQIPSSEHKVIIVLNDNGMAISKPVGALSILFRHLQTSVSYDRFKNKLIRPLLFTKPLFNIAYKIKNWIKRILIEPNLFDSLGFIYIGVIDGHNYKALDKAFKRAKKTSKSVVIHVRTKKGKGYKFAENDETGKWHGVKPFNPDTGEFIRNNSSEINWADVYKSLILERLENDPKFYLIGVGTLVGSNLNEALVKYPKNVIDTGISEEHAFILASNLAKLGYHVVISIYSTFMQRAFDQISHDIARIHSNVTVLIDHAGLVGNDGDTHQGIYDTAFLLSTPNINVFMPKNITEAVLTFNRSFTLNEASFIRYPCGTTFNDNNINRNVIYKDYDIIRTSGGNLLAIVSVGPLTNELAKLVNRLNVSMFSLLLIKPINRNLIKNLLRYKKILIYTPYETSHGFANSLLEELSFVKYHGETIVRAAPLKYINHASIEEQLNENHLLPKQIFNDIKKII